MMFDRFSYIRKLHEFYCDDKIFYLVESFEKYSIFHRFIEFVVEDVFHEESADVDLKRRKKLMEQFAEIPPALEDMKPEKLPIELAFEFNNIQHQSFSLFLKNIGKNFVLCNENDIYDYMVELRLSEEYESLVDQTVKEVFHVLFQNRNLLLLFNDMMAGALESKKNCDPPDECRHLFSRFGKLARKNIPRWVQRAVFFRDRGRCVLCDKDLSGTLNLTNVENYDHIVPLAQYGLNDVSNIQLLCKECNQGEKRDGDAITSMNYQSWYPYD